MLLESITPFLSLPSGLLLLVNLPPVPVLLLASERGLQLVLDPSLSKRLHCRHRLHRHCLLFQIRLYLQVKMLNKFSLLFVMIYLHTKGCAPSL
uniref:Uncharacterized protein n=1 Tax=Picea glauca TaxID=3330 RepID=A0A101M4I3_PICGL|nr:hypothetical protein ABT39_MTgene782 [Picea glauca]QHR90501.1 hypothetical protein Q903MT_gene4525 [Picea sitchensis]